MKHTYYAVSVIYIVQHNPARSSLQTFLELANFILTMASIFQK